MIKAFNVENPDIRVEPDITNYTEYIVDLQTTAVGGRLARLDRLGAGRIDAAVSRSFDAFAGLRGVDLGRRLGRSVLPRWNRTGAPGQPGRR